MDSDLCFDGDVHIHEEIGSSAEFAAEGSDSEGDGDSGVGEPTNAVEKLLVDFFRQFAPDRSLRGDASRLLAACKCDDDVTSVVAQLEAEYAPASLGFISEGRNHICFTSAFFDPLSALYDERALPPVLNVRPLDNVHKAQLLLPGSVQHRARVGILHGSRAAARDRLWRSGLKPAATTSAAPLPAADLGSARASGPPELSGAQSSGLSAPARSAAASSAGLAGPSRRL